jgi:hypothetical protein
MTTTFTVDLIFSYWLDAWFIVWLIASSIVKAQYKHVYDIPNPAVFLAGGLVQNLWVLSRMVVQTKWIYLGQIILLKFIPLCYAVYKFPRLNMNREIISSLKFGSGLALAYTAYLGFHGKTPWQFYSDMNKSILSGEKKLPFMQLASNIL